MIIKKCANSATTKFMEEREVRFLCIIEKDDLKGFGHLMIAAKECNLVMGKVLTMASRYDSPLISAAAGDVAIDLNGILGANKDKLLTMIDTPSMSSVRAVRASTAEINVSLSPFLSPKLAFSCLSCQCVHIPPQIIFL